MRLNPYGYPHGGVGPLIALAEAFGFTVLGVNECGKYESRSELLGTTLVHDEHPVSVLDQVRDGLKKHRPDLRYAEPAGMIVVPASAPNGFDVSISEDLRVGYDGWHEHFGTPDEAIECFALGLSNRCRLRVTYRGDSACKWTLELLEDGCWVEGSTTGLLFFPFWRAPRVEYRQNGSATGE